MATPRKKPEDKQKVGVKGKYTPAVLRQVEKLILLGAKDEKLIDFLQINSATFYRWQKAHPEFRELILRGKEKFDSTIADSLYRKANGYKHKATKIFFNADLAKMQIAMAAANGEEPPKEPGIVRADYIERYAPDTNAIAFYLTNRRSQTWKNRNDTNIDADVKGTVQHTVEWKAAPGCDPLTPPNELPENEQ
jgi:hypothetical protein